MTDVLTAQPKPAEEAKPAPAPDKLPSGRLHFRTLRVGASLTRTIFEMSPAEYQSLEESARVGRYSRISLGLPARAVRLR